MRIHVGASYQHSADHALAIWKHLSDDLRGDVFIDPFQHCPSIWPQDDVVLVTGYPDIERSQGRRCIYVEHGAGQRYLPEEVRVKAAIRHYHGSQHPSNVVAYLGPRQDVIDAWGREGYAVGAPILDEYQLFPEDHPSLDNQTPVAVITFHWNAATVCSEAESAVDHYSDQMPEIIRALQEKGFTVWGHKHPMFTFLNGYWARHGIYECTIDELRRHASLVIADNTSVLYEAAYLWRNVITLNAPWYRRDVHHGLRFWEWVPGIQVDGPGELMNVIDDGATWFDPRVAEYVYGKAHVDGHDGERAAMWLTAYVHSL